MLYVYVCVQSTFSHVWCFMTPWTVAHYAPLSMGLSRQEYWSGLLHSGPMPWSVFFLLQFLASTPEQCSLLRSGVHLKNMKGRLQYFQVGWFGLGEYQWTQQPQLQTAETRTLPLPFPMLISDRKSHYKTPVYLPSRDCDTEFPSQTLNPATWAWK